MVTHDESHLEAQERYWREHPEERPKPQGYLYRVSDAVRDIEAGIREIALQRRNGENFSDAFAKHLLSNESALRTIVTTLREQIEQEAAWASSAGEAQEVVS